MDFQNRAGSRPGSGGVLSEQQANIMRRERLRLLALETIDLAKDPYFMKNHLGSFECKLCLTLHPNEGSYLAHTQGKKHQTNLARRSARDGVMSGVPVNLVGGQRKNQVKVQRNFHTIGRPGYRVTKIRDPNSNQLGLLFQIHYPQIKVDITPKHRFMSAFEQKVDLPADRNYQYLLISAEPYEIIAFKIPSMEVDRSGGKFWTYWDDASKQFTLQLFFSKNALFH